MCPRYMICLFAVLAVGTSAGVRAQAICIGDGTGTECLDALTTARGPGSVVMDIFETSDGRFAPELTFATYIRGVNGCIGGTGFTDCGMGATFSVCRNILTGYQCGPVGSNPVGGNDPAFHANSLDWYWTQIFRTDDSGVIVADGDPGFYYPWTGRIMDLGGEANRVVLFPITDHVPLPCEAFEYSVWLSNNPDATSIAPESAPDPMQWNPARMIRAFTEGWTMNHTAEGAVDAARPDLGTFLRTRTTPLMGAVADALTTVWALPCGLSFRYVSIQAGNYGNPGPECAYHSWEDELDAVAGLNEDDTAICIDADGDGHRDASCGGSDCDDTDPAVHPGAFERCDATEDLNCLPMAACPAGTVCDDGSGLCVTQCFEGGCPDGQTCVVDKCIDSACAARPTPCAAGTLCRAGVCVAPCDGVVCPTNQECVGGACLDPCEGVLCPANQVCIARDPSAATLCGPSCDCDELTVPLCPTGTACDDRMGSPTAGECVDPGCEVVTCGVGEVCESGACVDGCAGVACPLDQICVEGACVQDLCARVVCPGTQVCREGACFDACDGVMCTAGMICQAGSCVADPCFGVSCGAGEMCFAGRCVPDGTVVDAGPGGSMDAGTGDAGPGGPDDGACGCRVVGWNGARSNANGGWCVLLLGALLVWRRRRLS